MTDEQKQQIKLDNDKLIRQKGYRVNDCLPFLESPNLRTIEEIKGRMSVMNALINIAFEAPIFIIRKWIEEQNLTQYLSLSEKQTLQKENTQLTDFEKNSLNWNLESLWAFMWATKMIESLNAEDFVGDNIALLLPNLQDEEDNTKIEEIEDLRTELEIYTMLDYYYRLHWYCVDERLNGKEPKLNEGLVYERRKALEWIFNRTDDWDDVEMST